MDEVLESDVKHVVRSLRVFERRSFIQMDDEEAQVIVALFLRRNQDILNGKTPPKERVFLNNSNNIHERIRKKGSHLKSYLIDIDNLIGKYVMKAKLHMKLFCKPGL